MQITDLPAPGLISMGLQLRTQAVKAINATKIVAGLHPNGKSPYAGQLKAFFDAASTAVAAYVDGTVPTVTAQAMILGGDAKKIALTFSEEMDTTSVAAISAWTVKVATLDVTEVSSAWLTDRILVVTLTNAVTTGQAVTIAYTKPGSGAVIQDTVGNDLATFTAVTVTNDL